MIRIVASLAAFIIPFVSLAQGPVDSAQIAAAEAKVRMASGFIDKSWAKTFTAWGERYVTPRLVGYDTFVMSACGKISGMNAHACDTDGAIYYSRPFLALLMTKTAYAKLTDGDMGAIVPIAHEWGHAVQNMLRLDYSSAADRVEADADCLAGAVIAQANTAGYLEQGDVAESEYSLQLVADDPLVGGDWGKAIEMINARAPAGSIPVMTNATGDHGNGRERVAAFHRGFESGARSCVLGIPRRTR